MKDGKGKIELLIVALMIVGVGMVRAVNWYTDDSYYWPVVDTTFVPTSPFYDQTKEFVFIEDSVPKQHPDTVRMVIR